MGLDIYLTPPEGELPKEEPRDRIYIRENGSTREISYAEWNERHPDVQPFRVRQDDDGELWVGHITHNLSKMADEIGLYKVLWRPEEIGLEYAHQIAPRLEEGLKKLKDYPDHYKKFNPPNGWGNYENLVDFLWFYLECCNKYPQATVRACR